MGAGASSAADALDATAKRHSLQEFTNLCPKERDHLILSEVRQLQSIEGAPMDMSHLPTLFVVDANLDGLFTLKEITDFAIMCGRKSREFMPHEFQVQMQGFCTLKMFDVISESGIDSFVHWFTALFSEGKQHHILEDYPGVEFMTRDATHLMHELLSIEDNYGYSQQMFFDVAQRAGEEKGMMRLMDERLDELVPLCVLEQFSRSFIEGLMQLMSELHFRPEPVKK